MVTCETRRRGEIGNYQQTRSSRWWRSGAALLVGIEASSTSLACVARHAAVCAASKAVVVVASIRFAASSAAIARRVGGDLVPQAGHPERGSRHDVQRRRQIAISG